MYRLGYYGDYLNLKRKYPQFKFDYPRDWSLKEYGTLFIYDLIKKNNARRVLEVGCGYNTFFAKNMEAIDVEYWSIDQSNDYLGIGQDKDRYLKIVKERESYGGRSVDGLLGQNLTELQDGYFDIVFSISVIEHIEDTEMPGVVEEIKRILRPGGSSAHCVDIYPRSKKAVHWHGYSKSLGFDVPQPYHDKWEFDGNYTTFIEQPKVRYLIYNSLTSDNALNDNVPYVSQFATMLCVAVKPELT